MNRSTRRPAATLAALALTALAIAACGGDTGRGDDASTAAQTGATSTTPAPAPTGANTAPVIARATDPARRAYIAKVDDVCSRLDKERSASEEEVSKAADGSEAAKSYDDSIKVGEEQYRQIKAIPPPPGDAKLLRANVYDVIERQLALRKQMATALETSDVPTLETLRAEHDTLTTSLVSFARGYGFKVCGED